MGANLNCINQDFGSSYGPHRAVDGAVVLNANLIGENKKPTLVVTPCSASKRRQGGPSADAIPLGNQATVARAWVDRLSSESELVVASDLYRGRAFTIACRVTKKIDADLGIVSAGMGYVHGGARIPSYNLTVSRTGPGSVAARVAGRFDPEAWWHQMQSGPFSTDLETDFCGRGLVLVCLSRSYAQLVISNLVRFARRAPAALRIFGLSIAENLPAELREFVLPYDARLEVVGPAGTRIDFPQRALADFADHILPSAKTLEDQKLAVLERLSAVRRLAPSRKQRRVSDDVVKAHIARLIPMIGGRSRTLLAHLRRIEGISCEQGRFARLYRSTKAEIDQ